MVYDLGNNYANACEIIKEIVSPELREKIENKNLLNNDITAIANSILIQENDDGSVVVKRKDFSAPQPNTDITKLRQEINLIRRICTANVRKPGEVEEAPVLKKQKSEEEPVDILRKNNKRKAIGQDEQPTKKQKQEKSRLKINEVGDMFSRESEIADAVLGMMADYIDKSPAAIIGMINCGQEIPKYLKDNIFDLDLSNQNMDLKTFNTLISEFKNLKSIKLPENANNLWIEGVAREFPNLKSLDVSGCKDLINDDLFYIALTMKSLTALNLSRCLKIGNEGVDCIFRELKLQSLHLHGCINISDEAFENIKESGKFLQDLCVGQTKISNIGLNYIIDDVKGIKRFSLIECRYITDRSVDRAIQTFKELEHLFLSYCNISDDGLINLNQRSKTLKTLKLENCRNITGAFLAHISHNFDVLKQFSLNGSHNLVKTNLNYMSGRFPALENLDLGNLMSNKLKNEVIVHVVLGAEKLEQLELTYSYVCDESLICIAKQCPNLKSLFLNHCTKITKIGVRAIFEGCINLQGLYLQMSHIDDDIFEGIAKKPCKLTKLNIGYNRKLTPIGFKYISKGCPDLKFIDLQSCTLTNGIISTLCFNNKDLEVAFSV